MGKYAEVEKKRDYGGHKMLKDEFREVQIKQMSKKQQGKYSKQRILPAIINDPADSLTCKQFCSSYWFLMLCWLILVSILATSAVLFIQCESSVPISKDTVARFKGT